MADSSEVKIEYFWCDAIAPRQADAGQARPAVERTALVRGEASVIHQHPANGFVVKPLAHLSPEGFSQDEIFKADTLTQRGRHLVPEVVPVLVIRFNRFAIGVQHAASLPLTG